jgi:hypothetical protein
MTTADPHPLLAFPSVRQWLDTTPPAGLRPAEERARKLTVLADFCAHVDCDPDSLVANARSSAEIKNGYLKRLVAWAAALPGSPRARHDAENTVRGFFMRNGFRVVARPYRDVYTRGSE